MNSGFVILITLICVLFLLILRWCHRCWGRAILSALFAPLVAVPLAAVAFLAIGLILRVLNAFLSGFGGELSRETLTLTAQVGTSLIVMFLGTLYCLDQRRLSLVKTGPRFGTPYQAPSPRFNQKGPLR